MRPVRLEPSDELRVMVRPFETYRALAEQERPGSWWRRPLLTLMVLGAFVSVTTAGRFALSHIVLVGIAWAFIPASQLGWLWMVRRRWGTHVPFGTSAHLFFAGQGGWLLVLIALIGLVTLAPGVADRINGAEWVGVVGIGALLALFHGMVVTFAFMRHVWNTTPRRALVATTSYYLGLAVTISTYYLSMGQLLPLMTGTP